MRVASAMIGVLGAGLGAAKGLFFVLFALVMPLGLGIPLFDPYVLLMLGTYGAVAISCVLGVVGAGLVVGGRLRAGALFMLVGVAVVPIAMVAYGLLQPLTQPPDVQAVLPTFPTYIGFYVLWLFPVPPLLVGAALAFFARQRVEE